MNEMTQVRGLTLRRPWGAICNIPDPRARKNVENRSWRPPSWMIGGWLAAAYYQRGGSVEPTHTPRTDPQGGIRH